MGEYEVRLSQRAAQDIVSIVLYISNELKAPEAAIRICDKIDEVIDSLQNNPKRHQLVADERLAGQGIRKIMAENYFVFYIVDEAKETVNIATVQYARRDWQRLL